MMSVSHVLWECPAYSNLRSNFLVALQGNLGMMGLSISSCLIWEDKFGSLLRLFILDVWEVRKVRL